MRMKMDGKRGTQRKENTSGTGRRDQIRLAQLLICLLLFLGVFIGRGVFPQSMSQVRGRILDVIGTEMDIRQALEVLGTSLLEKDSLLQELGQFCVAVFGSDDTQLKQTAAAQLDDYIHRELCFLTSGADRQTQAAHLLRLEQLPEQWQAASEPEDEPALTPEQTLEEQAVPATGTVLLKAEYSGRALPEKYTMDQLSLGQLDTAAPLTGTLHSGYGYRDHPIDGQYKFHGGLDIGGQKGDPIKAFADGIVEYIGENDTYGLYLQLDHGSGVKSFYAHCSKLYVKKGDRVELGEKIAAVGSTGAATGPHLHFEIKCCGIHVDPAYYL